MAELQGLGAQLSQAERAGVEIIAVSPDSNEHSQKIAEGLRLHYRFLADRDGHTEHAETSGNAHDTSSLPSACPGKRVASLGASLSRRATPHPP